MKSAIYCLNAAFVLVHAIPKPQAAVVSGSAGLLPSVPASAVPATPTPFANAALWHEAVTDDATVGLGAENQYFYALVAYLQTQENSSLNIGSDFGSDPLLSAELVSKGLQKLTLYPTEFNQAQALDPGSTQGGLILPKRV